MSMRSVFKGHIRMAMVSVAVKLYNMIDATESVKLNMIHVAPRVTEHDEEFRQRMEALSEVEMAKFLKKKKKTKDEQVFFNWLENQKVACKGAVGYKNYCKACDVQIELNEIGKGYNVGSEQFVQITAEDFDKIKLKSTKVVDIEAFIPQEQIPVAYYEKPHFIAPDGDVAMRTYALIRQALIETKTVGIGKISMREREDIVVIAPFGDGIALYAIRYPNEVRSFDMVPGIEATKKVQVDPEQVKMASKLMNTMRKDFSAIQMKDQYNESLKTMIAAKIAGADFSMNVAEVKQSADVMADLQASIELAKKTKSA